LSKLSVILCYKVYVAAPRQQKVSQKISPTTAYVYTLSKTFEGPNGYCLINFFLSTSRREDLACVWTEEPSGLDPILWVFGVEPRRAYSL
jgi:hypothetical protein